MRRKNNNFLEQYADKLILAIFGIVSLWLLFTQVLGGGSFVEYDSRKFGPGQIDKYIESQARDLEEKLETQPEKPRKYESKLKTYESLLDSAINGVNASVHLPMPSFGSKTASDERTYHLPEIGLVDDVAVQLVRSVAYNPLHEEMRTDNTEIEDELLDVDLVTVQGSFDTAKLYKRFHDSFAGTSVPEEWRDAKLATPVFAAVRLERQKMAKDGSWPKEWQSIARPTADPLRDALNIPESASELQLGVEILMVQLDNPEVRIGLLQPQIYDFALPLESWLPPSLFQARQERLEKMRDEDDRRPRRDDRERTGERRGGDKPTRDITTRGGRGGGGRGGRRTTTRESERTTRIPGRRGPEETRGRGAAGRDNMPQPEDSEQAQFESIMLTETTDLENMEKPLVFWAHDDTTEPGQTYRYRIRIGVLNPISDTDWYDDESRSLKGHVTLWSDYSAVTKPVTIPNKLYFFPVQVRESDKTLTVDVKKYLLGRWYSHNFNVKPGESIGEIVTQQTGDVHESGPSSIDYKTGAVLLDLRDISDWDGTTTLRPRNYSEVLYTQDGENIEHLPVQSRYWPSELRQKFDEIKKEQEKQEENPLVLGGRPAPGSRSAGGGRGRTPGMSTQPTPGIPGRAGRGRGR